MRRTGLWVPETVHTALDLLLPRQLATGMIRGALQLIYLVFSKLLSWMVLRTRSDTAKEIEILVLRHQLACCNGAVLDLGSAGPTEP
jgi:hypothetical protein